MKKPEVSLESLRAGFDRYLEENGVLPSCWDIDATPYLPTTRYIESRFGGVVKLRKDLGYGDIDFTKGVHRSKSATEINQRARKMEEILEKQLYSRFGEIAVHSEKPLRATNQRIDFYIYTDKGNFAVDLFHAKSDKSAAGCLGLKLKRYRDFAEPLYLVCGSHEVSERQVGNMIVCTTERFFELIDSKYI